MRAVLLTCVGVLLLLTLLILYFTKKNVDNEETRIYKRLLIYSTIFNVVGILTFVVAKATNDLELIAIYQKVYLSLMVIINYFALKYCIVLIVKKNIAKKVTTILFIFTIFLIIGVIVTPLTAIFYDDVLDGKGLSYDIAVYYTIGSLVFFLLETLYMVFTKKFVKKIIPFITLTLLYLVGLILRGIYPELTFEGFFYAYILLVMFHTIENPDLKMLNEFIKNKELVEIGVQEKTNLLFKITQDVKTPIKKIASMSQVAIKNENLEDMKNDLVQINEATNNVIKTIDNIFDISELDKKNIKLVDATYNIYNLFTQIVYLVKEKTYSDSKVEFKYNISNVTPALLHGDSSRLKQIICSIIFNGYRNTEQGVIDFDISSIVKYDICRLIIKISDTGGGMNLDVINDILENNDPFSEQDMQKLTGLDIDLKLIKKVVELQGGHLLINSDNLGSTFTVVLDQEIEQEEKTQYVSEMAKSISNKEKALVIDDDYKELEYISNELKENGLDIIQTMYGKDCIDRISNGEEYDYIFIDDDMDKYNAVTTIQELQKLKIKLPKIIIMLSPASVKIKEHFLEDYPFDDYLIKDEYTEEIQRIIFNKK